jgi:hypothetical protein
MADGELCPSDCDEKARHFGRSSILADFIDRMRRHELADGFGLPSEIWPDLFLG